MSFARQIGYFVVFGAAAAVGMAIVERAFGGRRTTVVQSNSPPQYGTRSTGGGGGGGPTPQQHQSLVEASSPCFPQQKTFNDCLSASGNSSANSCSPYYQALSTCLSRQAPAFRDSTGEEKWE